MPSPRESALAAEVRHCSKRRPSSWSEMRPRRTSRARIAPDVRPCRTAIDDKPSRSSKALFSSLSSSSSHTFPCLSAPGSSGLPCRSECFFSDRFFLWERMRNASAAAKSARTTDASLHTSWLSSTSNVRGFLPCASSVSTRAASFLCCSKCTPISLDNGVSPS